MAPSVLFVTGKGGMPDEWHCHHLLVKGQGFHWVPGARINVVRIHVWVSFEILLVLNLDWGYNWREHRQGEPGVNRVWGRCRGGDSAQQHLMTKGLVAGLAPGRQSFRFNG
jgi:hypothetical protein